MQRRGKCIRINHGAGGVGRGSHATILLWIFGKKLELKKRIKSSKY
jgi:hypothetical protein